MHNRRGIIVTIQQTIDFREPTWIIPWLATALEKEKEKYKKCPVRRDLLPGHEAAQGWGYVVAGYFLVEESFKALLFVRGKQVPRKHSLSTLFDLCDDADRRVLREYYVDFRGSVGTPIGTYPFTSLDDFLTNLDGDKNKSDDHIGSFDWRYFLIEVFQSQRMPIVSVDYMHETAFAGLQIVKNATYGVGEPEKWTLGWRMYWKRHEKFSNWMTTRMNSGDWSHRGDRLEILWGPDYRGRHDFVIVREGGGVCYFSELPQNASLPIVDMRKDFDAFDPSDALYGSE